MKKNILIFLLGFASSTMLFVILLSSITIPEFIFTHEIECKQGLII